MKKLALLLVLGTVAGFGQYTWHSTTTTFPPSDPPFNQPSTYLPYLTGLGYLANPQGYQGGEVRSVIVRDYAGNAYGNQWIYEHVLGATFLSDPYGNYNWDFYFVRIFQSGWQPWTLTIGHVTPSGMTQLAQYTINAPTTGTLFSSSIRQNDGPNGEGQGINVRLGADAIYLRFSNAPLYGRQGFSLSSNYGQQFSDLRVGSLETNPPNLVTGLSATVSNGVLTANWNATNDDAYGIGNVRYEVFRGTQSLGTTASTTWTMPVQPGESFTFNVKPYDGHRNFQVATGVAVSVPPASTGLVDDSRRVGVHARSVQWGAMGESIDTRSMNVNYTVPLLKAQGRGGLGLGLSLNYNSQNWRKEGSTVSKAGADVGYGFGWKLLAGSIIPVFSNPTTLSYYMSFRAN